MLALTTIFLLLIRNTELYKQYVCGNLISTVMLICLDVAIEEPIIIQVRDSVYNFVVRYKTQI